MSLDETKFSDYGKTREDIIIDLLRRIDKKLEKQNGYWELWKKLKYSNMKGRMR